MNRYCIGLISLEQTIFSFWSMGIVLTIMLVLPQVMRRLAPPDDEVVEYPFRDLADDFDEHCANNPSNGTPSEKMENARWITLSLGTSAGVYVAHFFATGGELQLDSLNMIFVAAGLLFADSPRHYIELLRNAAGIAGPFLIQFPLYAGLMGLITD